MSRGWCSSDATKNGAQTAIAVPARPMAGSESCPAAIAVAGNLDGFVVAQPGKYVFDPDGERITAGPDRRRVAAARHVTKVLGDPGSAFAWVATPS